jgi:hypothetical protein
MVRVTLKTLTVSACIWTSVFFLAALIFVGLGGNLYSHSYSKVAISVPFFPETGDEFGLFVGVTAGSDIVPRGRTGNLTIDFSLSELESPEAVHDLYIVHNLWGYDISLTVVDGSLTAILTFDDSRNIEGSPEVTVTRPTEQWVVPEWVRFGREMFVKCPAGHTLITAAEDAEPGCEAIGGALMPIGERLEALFVGSIDCAELQPPVSIVFHELVGLPMDFVQVPQVYIASWRWVTSIMFIAGAVLLPLSLIVCTSHIWVIVGRIYW